MKSLVRTAVSDAGTRRLGLAAGPAGRCSAEMILVSASAKLRFGIASSSRDIFSTRSRRNSSLNSLRLRLRILTVSARTTRRSTTPEPKKTKYSIGTAEDSITSHSFADAALPESLLGHRHLELSWEQEATR